MWKYILLLAIFNMGYGIGLLTSPDMLMVVKDVPLYGDIGHLIAAGGFLLSGILCLVEVIYRLGKGIEVGGLLYFRFLVQGFSLIMSLIWMAGVILAFFLGGGPISGITSWVLIAVGQAVMLRPSDFQTQPQEETLLKKLLEDDSKQEPTEWTSKD